MPDRAVTELQQIPFSHLIGSPLKAAVEAQAMAAQSTIEFIHKVGFKEPEAGPTDLVFADPTADDERRRDPLGHLQLREEG